MPFPSSAGPSDKMPSYAIPMIDVYPLPRPDEVQDHLAGSSIFSTLNYMHTSTVTTAITLWNALPDSIRLLKSSSEKRTVAGEDKDPRAETDRSCIRDSL